MVLMAVEQKPLLEVLKGKKMRNIDYPRLCRLKEKTLGWKFDITHIMGKSWVGQMLYKAFNPTYTNTGVRMRASRCWTCF